MTVVWSKASRTEKERQGMERSSREVILWAPGFNPPWSWCEYLRFLPGLGLLGLGFWTLKPGTTSCSRLEQGPGFCFGHSCASLEAKLISRATEERLWRGGRKSGRRDWAPGLPGHRLEERRKDGRVNVTSCCSMGCHVSCSLSLQGIFSKVTFTLPLSVHESPAIPPPHEHSVLSVFLMSALLVGISLWF